jgi:hypothetical protein
MTRTALEPDPAAALAHGSPSLLLLLVGLGAATVSRILPNGR